jgi:hypothetical protein
MGMSGIDEIAKDIPRCPRCGEIPNYWTLKSMDGKPVLWLYSQEYRDSLSEKYYMGEGYFSELKNLEDFWKAVCMGKPGCGVVLYKEEEGRLFGTFLKLFFRYFPHRIRQTD